MWMSAKSLLDMFVPCMQGVRIRMVHSNVIAKMVSLLRKMHETATVGLMDVINNDCCFRSHIFRNIWERKYLMMYRNN